MNKKEICYSSYCGDVAPALLVLNGKVVLERHGGSREISLESLFSGNGKVPLSLQRGEILTEIIIPEEALDGFSTYVKFANRGGIEFPIVGMGLWASMERKEVRVAFTGVDRRPVRAKSLEGLLAAKDLSDERLEQAVRLVSKEVTLVKTSIYSPSYKKKIMGRLLESALKEAARKGRR